MGAQRSCWPFHSLPYPGCFPSQSAELLYVYMCSSTVPAEVGIVVREVGEEGNGSKTEETNFLPSF